MEPRYTLRCLGLPALITPGGDQVRFRTRKHLALLIFLAVEPRVAHRRDRLADLLWGSAPLAEARHSLATALSVLRSRFGRDGFESAREHVRLVTTALDLDLDRLRAGDVLGDEFTPPLEIAGFLDGFELQDATEFMYWRERQQALWLPTIKTALIRQMDRCRRTGNFAEIEGLADRMLGLDELSEEAIRAKMEARAFAGDRLTALRIFEEWENRLAAELGAVPSPLVEGMAVRLRRRGWERPTNHAIPAVQTDQWKGRPFVGRGPQYQALYEGWERTRRGEPGHACVMGDSGIGKSTLVARLTTAAGLEGASSMRVQCYELEQELPYAALSGLVLGLLSRPGVSATPPEALAELALTVPEVRRRFPELPVVRETEGETARIRLAEAFHEMARAVAEEHPLILVVDDVHLADNASLTILHLLLRKARGEPIMLILALRPAELDAEGQVGRMLERAEALGISRIELPPMTEAECAAVVAGSLPPELPPPSPTVRRALIQAAAGYPMVLELLVQDWIQNGSRCLAIALGAMTADPEGGRVPAAGYQPLIERLARSLDATTRNVLNLAAILGHRMNDLSMYGLADLTTGQTMTGLAHLVDLRLLRDGGEGLEFANELVRGRAYLSVPSPVRRALHGDIAERLLGEESRGVKVSGLEIAWHLTRGGRAPEATPYLLRGAREALQRGAPHEAERALSSGMPIVALPRRSEALFLLAQTQTEQGRWQEALEALHGSQPDSGALIEAHDIMRLMCQRHLGRIPVTEQESVLRYLLAVMDASPTPINRIRAALTASYIAAEQADVELARTISSRLQQLPMTAVAPDERSEYMLARALAAYHSRDRLSSLELVSTTIAELTATDAADTTLVRLWIGRGAIRCSLGDYSSALDDSLEAFRLARRLENDRLSAQAAANASLCYGRIGDYTRQLEWALTSKSLQSPPATMYALNAAYSAALAYAFREQHEHARDALHAVQEIALHGPGWMGQWWHLRFADLLLLSGRVSDAVQSGIRGTSGERTALLAESTAGPYARWVARVCRKTGEYERAIPVINGLISRLDRFDVIDRAEILIASLEVDFSSDNLAERQHLLTQALGQLPDATVRHIERLRLEWVRRGEPSRLPPRAS